MLAGVQAGFFQQAAIAQRQWPTVERTGNAAPGEGLAGAHIGHVQAFFAASIQHGLGQWVLTAALQGAGLPAAAEAMPPGGDVRVWTARPAGGPPLAVVEARDAAALRAVARPLPHYGSQSWLVFDGGRMLARGVWDAPGPALAVER